MPLRVLFIFGTRPEAIKLCPLVGRLRTLPERFSVRTCVTGQHRDMLDPVLEAFSVVPDSDLNLMLPGQSLPALTARILAALEPVLASESPDLVVVQGDTTTTFGGALAAFYQRIPVAHVEAGLRTGDMTQPFPEEMNRVLTTRLASLHMAPTAEARAALRREGVANEDIYVTGNTGVDAVLFVREALQSGSLRGPGWPWLDASRRLVVLTSHRRENFGEGFERAMRAIVELADRDDVQVVYPVHRNPNILEPAHRILERCQNVVLIEPVPYVSFVDLMRRARFVITDSGGIQEEAPSLGKPVLVLRDKTERPEAVAAGTVKLVGTNTLAIVAEATRLLDDETEYQRMAAVHNPYGDGHACERIADILTARVG